MGKDKEIAERKQAYRAKLENLLDTYKSILIVTADNVGSNQMQKIRIALRGKGILLMGKNTIMRKVVREKIPSAPKYERLLPQIVGNIGFVFTNGDLNEVRKVIEEHKVPAAARVGTLAPGDCWVPAGPTGLDPGQTGFFQALNIATKIVKGSVEIINDVHLIKTGQKVTPSHVSLLSKLDIKPFFYRMSVTHIFDDGTVFSAAVLDMSKEDLMAKFMNGVSVLTALSLRIGVPSVATLSHNIAHAMQALLGIALATDLTFKQAEPFKEYLADPAAYAAKHGLSAGPAKATPAPAAAPAKGGAPAKKEEPKKVEEEEEEDVGGFGLFGDD